MVKTSINLILSIMMLFKTLIFSKDWTDIVFANRNKEYGAYQLRQMSAKATNISLLIVMVTVSGMCVLSFVSKSDENTEVLTIENVDNTFEMAPKVEMLDEVMDPLPKEEKLQQVAQDIAARDLIRYTEINPTNQSLMRDDLAEHKEVMDRNKLIASLNLKGQKGGELITKGTFGRSKRDGGTVGGSKGDIEGGIIGDYEVLNLVEIMPEPIGGMESFVQWIAQNYIFPQAAMDDNVKGLIQVKFVVEKDGSLSSFEIVKDMGYGTGKEAIKLLKKAKNWNPGIQNGVPVRVAFTLPIRLNTL